MANTQRPEVPEIAPGNFEIYLRSYFDGLKATLDERTTAALTGVLRVLARARLEHRRIFIVGDGGSAAPASDTAGGRNTGTTGEGSDPVFEHSSAGQLAALMTDGDVVVFSSASGSSPDLVGAAQYARSRGGELVGLIGFAGGTLATLVDHAVVVSSRDGSLPGNSHLLAQHALTHYLRRLLVGPPRPVAFVDRDGVINERPAPHQYVTRWEDFHWLDGILPLLRGLSAMGFPLLVITNQQGVGKGILSDAGLEGIHGEMTRSLEREGITLDRVLHCPHLERDRCPCRKPRPGLIYRALNETPFLIDVARSVVIGDADSDMQAGMAAGVGTRILVGGEGLGMAATHYADRVEDVLAVVSR